MGKARQRQIRGSIVALALTLALGLCVLRLMDPIIVSEVRNFTFDAYQRLAPRPAEDYPVRIVDIDEAALSAAGQWPWARTRVAALVDRLATLGAAVVAFDIVFSEPDRTTPLRFADQLETVTDVDETRLRTLLARLPDHDQILAAAFNRVPVVVAFSAVDEARPRLPAVKSGYANAGVSPREVLPAFPGAVATIPVLEEPAAGVGGVNFSGQDRSGITRRLPLLFSDGTKTYPSLVLEALRVAQGQMSIVTRGTGASGEADTGRPALVDLRVGQFQVPVTTEGELWLSFDRGRPERAVSARDVFDPAQDATTRPLIEGHIVFVGSSAAGLASRTTTPLGENVPGVVVHAVAAEQILAQSFLSRPDWANGAEIIATVLLCLTVIVLLQRVGPTVSLAIFVGITVLALVVSYGAFARDGVLIDPVFPLFSVAVVHFVVTALLYRSTDKEKRFVRQAFSQYLAPQLLHRLEEKPDSMSLGGEIRPLTIMFMDVRDFTPISESLTAHDLVHFLNTLFSPLSDVIMHEDGTIDKFIGDSIMAFWNAPVAVDGHARRACMAALRMREEVARMNLDDAFGFRAAGRMDLAAKIGIGINTGEACVGNMGSSRRFNYSAIGDAVNTAARIESSCKAVGCDLIISQTTLAEAGAFAVLDAGAIPLKGKSNAQRLYALVGDEAHAETPAFRDLAERHRTLVAALDGGEPTWAAAALARCQEVAPPLLTEFYARFAEKVAALPQSTPAQSAPQDHVTAH